jgi:hypothetical protein
MSGQELTNWIGYVEVKHGLVSIEGGVTSDRHSAVYEVVLWMGALRDPLSEILEELV